MILFAALLALPLLVSETETGTLHRLCGLQLLNAQIKICTWEGEHSPCFHSSSSGYDKDSSDEFETSRRFPRSMPIRTAVEVCCDQRCDPRDLRVYCCTEREAREYYRQAALLAYRELQRRQTTCQKQPKR